MRIFILNDRDCYGEIGGPYMAFAVSDDSFDFVKAIQSFLSEPGVKGSTLSKADLCDIFVVRYRGIVAKVDAFEVFTNEKFSTEIICKGWEYGR